MIINNFSEKGKEVLDTILSAILLVLTLTAGWGGYSLYKLQASEPLIALESTQLGAAAESLLPNTSEVRSVSTTTGSFVASKNGKAYYLPTCTAAQRILEKNKIWFQTREEAQKAGYVPAKNCKGL